jgi:hypothetical protein
LLGSGAGVGPFLFLVFVLSACGEADRATSIGASTLDGASPLDGASTQADGASTQGDAPGADGGSAGCIPCVLGAATLGTCCVQ